MGQYVMEFTSVSAEAALALLDQFVVPKKSLQTLSCAEKDTLQYRPAEGELVELLPDLIAGRVCSIIVHSESDTRYGLLTCPRFNGQDLSQWMATIEFETEAWHPIWDKIVTDRNVTSACVGMEEGIDLTDGMLNVTGFPWADPSLLAGAVRRSDGSWELRGPNLS